MCSVDTFMEGLVDMGSGGRGRPSNATLNLVDMYMGGLVSMWSGGRVGYQIQH